MKKKTNIFIISAYCCLIALGLVGCGKRIDQHITVGSKTAGGSNQLNLYIDKSYTFRDYIVDETKDGVTVTLRFKPYTGDCN